MPCEPSAVRARARARVRVRVRVRVRACACSPCVCVCVVFAAQRGAGLERAEYRADGVVQFSEGIGEVPWAHAIRKSMFESPNTKTAAEPDRGVRFHAAEYRVDALHFTGKRRVA